MHRTRLALVAAPVLTGLLLSAAPAHAEPVKRKDIVGAVATAKVFPAFKDVSIAKFEEDTFSYLSSGPDYLDCSENRTAKGTSGMLVDGFDYEDGRSLRVSGQVVRFKRVAKAKRIFAAVRRHVRLCDNYWMGVDTTQRPAPAPKVGDQRIGYRLTERFAPELDEPTRHTIAIAIRDGRRVATLSVERTKRIPAKRFAKLARIAATKMK